MKTTSRRRMEGLVISNKMQKTAVVQTAALVKHAKYGKYFRKFKKLKVHDEKSECQVGDRVEIMESSPISKEKKFRLVKVLEKAKHAEAIE
ncbi:MAG: 30S ribosomal protein S17 [Deltaproteobacteria bacterium]|nr:30S ribosomal protein S17 [Deltaproteobacteria bacterium]